MTASAIEARPQCGWRVLGHNPFYPISAVCMTIGCVTLSRSMAISAGGLWKLITLIGVLNLYELMLIVLGATLYRRWRQEPDGRMLLVVEVFFLVDATHLNAELFGANIMIGGAINGLLYLLAIGKIALAIKLLDIRIAAERVAMLAAAIAVLFALPGGLAIASHHVSIDPGVMYTVAWGVALLMLVHVMGASRRHRDGRTVALHRLMGQVAVAGVYAALAAHVLMAAWVYHVPIRGYLIAPMVLVSGAGTAALLCDTTPRWRRRIELLAPVVAIGLTLWDGPGRWWWELGVVHLPTQLIFASAVMMYFVSGLRYRRKEFFIVACLLVVAGLLGGTPAAILARLREAATWCWDRRPQSNTAWGIVSVGSAYVMLGIGAGLSWLSKTRRQGGKEGGDQIAG